MLRGVETITSTRRISRGVNSSNELKGKLVKCYGTRQSTVKYGPKKLGMFNAWELRMREHRTHLDENSRRYKRDSI
jgi:hypothetical protein